MTAFFDSMNLWLNAHQDWILLTILFFAFLESLALVGIVVPGIAVLIAASTVAGSTDTNVWLMLLAAFTGAVLGDGLSFLLGFHYHHVIRNIKPFSTHPQWIEKGEQFFRQYGTMGIVLGRFVGPIRPVMPLVAGLMEMSPWRFFSINILSALAWSPFYLMPGYLVGKSIDGKSALSGGHLGFVLGVILLGWLFAQFAQRLHASLHVRLNKLQLALRLAGIFALLFLVTGWVAGTAFIAPLNNTFAQWMLALRHEWLDVFFVGLTTMGEYLPMALWATLISVTLLLQRNFYATTLWLGAVLLAQMWMELGKTGFGLLRPELVELPPLSFAYPSGHTCMIVVYTGVLASLALPSINARRHQLILSFCSILVVLVAASRLYLTVHWLTDIIGGLLLGGLVLMLFYWVVLRYPFRRVRPLPLLLASVLAWIINILLFAVPHFTDLLAGYQLR